MSGEDKSARSILCKSDLQRHNGKVDNVRPSSILIIASTPIVPEKSGKHASGRQRLRLRNRRRHFRSMSNLTSPFPLIK